MDRTRFFSSVTFATIVTMVTAILAGCSGAGVDSAAANPGNAGKDRARTVTVSASETVSLKPDLVMINAGVVSEDRTAQNALKKNTAAMSFVLAELKKSGIEERDLQTSNFNVAPRYRYVKNQAPEIEGYRVTNSLAVRVREIAKLGEILDKVVSLGSNQINNIQFQVSDADKAKDAARKAAVESAKRKATLYAEAAGAELGEIQTISESTRMSQPRPFAMTEARVSPKAAPVPIAAGEQTLTVRVNTVWEIK